MGVALPNSAKRLLQTGARCGRFRVRAGYSEPVPRAPLPTGKLPTDLLRELLAEGAQLPAEVRLGPGVGEDACAIQIGPGALIVATDPITLTGSGVGAHAVAINANDVAVMGTRPRWFLAVVLLPEGTGEEEVRELFAATRDALDEIGATLVGGHTEVTPAVTQPVVVGQMLGLCENGKFVRTGGVRPGDAIVQVGRAPVEGAALLARAERDRLADLPPALLARAERALEEPGISVVESSLLAAELGASALHDPTEGGLSAGLHELAEASGVGLEIDPAEILWFEPGRAVCETLGADPWGTLASGALLAAFRSQAAARAVTRLGEAGFPVRAIGAALQGSGVRLVGGAALPRYDRDEVARVLAGEE